jgi:hypothetical protein
MRFLMNTLVALISTAVDSCVPSKLSLETLGLSCCRVSEACLTIIRAYRQGHIEQLSLFRHSLNPASPSYSCAIAPFESSPRRHLHLSSKVLFPYPEP